MKERKIKCNGRNCTAVNGVGHSNECIMDHERAYLPDVGNGDAYSLERYHGYSGRSASPDYSERQIAAWYVGLDARNRSISKALNNSDKAAPHIQPNTWLPIKDAPSDGTLVDVYGSTVGRFFNCFYDKHCGAWRGYCGYENGVTHFMVVNPPIDFLME